MLKQIRIQQQLQEVQEVQEFKMPKGNKAIKGFNSPETFVIIHRDQYVEHGIKDMSAPRETMHQADVVVNFSDTTTYVGSKGEESGYIQHHLTGTNPFRIAITSGIAGGKYHDEAYKAVIEEGNNDKDEIHYYYFNDQEGSINEILVKHHIKGIGAIGTYNTKISTNQVEYYDLQNSQMASFIINSKGGITDFYPKELTAEELEKIKKEAVELRKEAIESFKKTPVFEKARNDGNLFYEKYNPLPTDDGKGSIDLQKLQEEVDRMINGQLLPDNTKNSWASAKLDRNKGLTADI